MLRLYRVSAGIGRLNFFGRYIERRMGPIIIFDKSFLESLNPDEAMWLDNFFLSNITPLFFVETLADLEKQIRAGRTAEEVVGSLAYKTPDASSKCNAHHSTLLAGELSGAGQIEMTYGRPILPGGQMIELDGKMGIIFRQSPEEEAFHRWQCGEFLDLERSLAKMWRRSLSNLNLEENYRIFQRFFPMGRPKTLPDVKKFVDFHIGGPDQEKVLLFGLSLLGIPERSQKLVFSRWNKSGKQTVREFAPYFAYLFSVDLFFNFAIAGDLIGRGRPSHKIDLAYLYYLPFCMIFTSNDKLHARIVPFFLRENQTYVPGSELKSDLAKLDAHYNMLPDEVKDEGVISFAFHPPPDDTFLVTRLWDKHMAPQWREIQNTAKSLNRGAGKIIMQEVQRLKKEGNPVANESRVHSDEVDQLIIERKVYRQKGKWKRFPPEVVNKCKKEKAQRGDDKPEICS